MIDARKILNLGPPLSLPPALDELQADITPMDVAVARMLWLQYAPDPLKGLLDAQTATSPQ